jgi:hypothetical protein
LKRVLFPLFYAYPTKLEYAKRKRELYHCHNCKVRSPLILILKKQTPLKPTTEEAQKKLQVQIAKLDGMSSKIQQKDKIIFDRIVKAIQNHDSHYGKLLSGELSQIRKMIKMIDSAKTAFEQLQLRLNTMTELGDVVVTFKSCNECYKRNSRRIVFYDAASRSIFWTDFRSPW